MKIKRLYSKVFSGPNAFAKGLSELKTVFPPARTAIDSATNKCTNLSTLIQFSAEVWPAVDYDKTLICLLAMQALLAPKAFSTVTCRTSHEGLLYRTNSGNIFGWRRFKNGDFIFTIAPMIQFPVPNFGWFNHQPKGLPQSAKRDMQDLLLPLVEKKIPTDVNQAT